MFNTTFAPGNLTVLLFSLPCCFFVLSDSWWCFVRLISCRCEYLGYFPILERSQLLISLNKNVFSILAIFRCWFKKVKYECFLLDMLCCSYFALHLESCQQREQSAEWFIPRLALLITIRVRLCFCCWCACAYLCLHVHIWVCLFTFFYKTSRSCNFWSSWGNFSTGMKQHIYRSLRYYKLIFNQ